MDIILENCNNITQGRAIIVEGALNIKYAINGTGKSTISKAITAVVNPEFAGYCEYGCRKLFWR